ncbi:MAG: hypothetical protein CM1200mP40_27600 [Gammaproteobacteria bacterium]|nr:MAG: hypothetical protein CM1200mP40_27600 [Gammaproteobacteria bacterium]
MDIEGLGSKLVDQLVDEKLISNVADIYSLTLNSYLNWNAWGQNLHKT